MPNAGRFDHQSERYDSAMVRFLCLYAFYSIVLIYIYMLREKKNTSKIHSQKKIYYTNQWDDDGEEDEWGW